MIGTHCAPIGLPQVITHRAVSGGVKFEYIRRLTVFIRLVHGLEIGRERYDCPARTEVDNLVQGEIDFFIRLSFELQSASRFSFLPRPLERCLPFGEYPVGLKPLFDDLSLLYEKMIDEGSQQSAQPHPKQRLKRAK